MPALKKHAVTVWPGSESRVGGSGQCQWVTGLSNISFCLCVCVCVCVSFFVPKSTECYRDVNLILCPISFCLCLCVCVCVLDLP